MIRDYVLKECETKRLLGPFYPQVFSDVHVSKYEVIPKADLGNWRLIPNFSSPKSKGQI